MKAKRATISGKMSLVFVLVICLISSFIVPGETIAEGNQPDPPIESPAPPDTTEGDTLTVIVPEGDGSLWSSFMGFLYNL